MPALVPPDPVGLRAIITRAEALEAGFTDERIRSLRVSGRWAAVDRGIYQRSAVDEEGMAQRQRHVHCIQAAVACRRRTGSVVGAGSAALLHGLPLVSGTPDRVRLLVPPSGWRGIRGQVHSSLAHLTDGDLTVAIAPNGMPVPVTTLARTWVDIARTHALADALSVGDAALRSGLMTRDDASAVLDRIGRLRGRRRAELALTLLDERRESPLESGSAAHFIGWGFPAPRLQHTFADERGFIAISDFDWPDHHLIGFADGFAKYGLDPRRDRVERRQESRLRPYGIVARWGWTDIVGEGRSLYELIAPLLGIQRPYMRAAG